MLVHPFVEYLFSRDSFPSEDSGPVLEEGIGHMGGFVRDDIAILNDQMASAITRD